MCDAYRIAKKVSYNLSGLLALLATVMFVAAVKVSNDAMLEAKALSRDRWFLYCVHACNDFVTSCSRSRLHTTLSKLHIRGRN
jgi:hypothetical protein